MPRGLFGRRYIDQPNWIAHLLDPLARDMTPAENPYGRSVGNVAFGNGYTPPTYTDDIQASGVARQPLSSLLTNAPTPEAPPMQQGLLSNAHDIIPNAPQGPSQEQQNAQAMRAAIASARANRGEWALNPNTDPQWRADRIGLDRAREENDAAQAELASRERIPFSKFWHFGGRQSPEWQYGRDPYYRFDQVSDDPNQPPPERRGLFASRSRR